MGPRIVVLITGLVFVRFVVVGALPWLFSVFFLFLLLVIFWIHIGNEKMIIENQKISRRWRGVCEKCEYNLTGNISGKCPECGTPVAAKPVTSA